MMKLTTTSLLVYLVLSSGFTLAESYEKELIAQIDAGSELWNKQDKEQLVNWYNTGYRGFGFRSLAARQPGTVSPKAATQGLDAFFSSLEYFRIMPGERHIEFDGDVAMVWGFHTEEFKHKGRPAERLRVRSSATFLREQSGLWRQLLSHRDVQEFDDGGRYIPVAGD